MNVIGRILVVALFSLTACAAPRQLLMKPVPTLKPAARADIRAVTFNTGLAPGITRYAKERLPLLAGTFARLDYDLLCLEEVWTREEQQTVIDALNLPPENVYYVETEGEGETGQDVCTADQLKAITACAKKKCADEAPEDMTACAATQCTEEGIMLYLHGRACLNCLIASAGKNMDEITRTCTSRTGASRSYDGRNGVILASRWPLLDKGVVPLPSSGANRVALMAHVDVPDRGHFEVACTHLSSRNEVSPTNPAFSDWSEEQQAQVKVISEKLQFRAPGKPQIFMGDMNFGQRNEPVVTAIMWASWRLAADLGFVSPVEYADPPFCSWCHGNRLNTDGLDNLIDHVMIRNPANGPSLAPVGVQRLFDDPVTIVDWKGRPTVVNLSDHYGVAVELVFR